MLAPELLAKVRRIEIASRRKVTEALAGEYVSAFRGEGMEFAEVREYVPGDEVRTIDWNVTARAGRPYVKRFVEERERTVFFAVDMSGSMNFGSGARLKREMAAELAAVLAFSAVEGGDRVGLLVYTDRIESHIPPRKGRRHALRVIRDILACRPEGRRTRTDLALDHALRSLRRHAILFLVSDLQDTGYERNLRIAGRKHDVIALTLRDERERTLPPVGLARVTEPETGEVLLLDTASRRVREWWRARWEAADARRREALRRSGVDGLELSTESDFVEPLLACFRRRERRYR
jgi:uncharacterized protein (DUF58 family)